MTLAFPFSFAPLQFAPASGRLFVTCLLLLSSISLLPSVSGYGYDSGAGPSHCLNEALIPLVEKPVICLLGGDVNVLVFGEGERMWLSVDHYPENGDLSSRWTHHPVCIENERNDLDERGDDEVEEEFCIFTNSTFNHFRGVSIFTTPSIAREFSQLPAFQSHFPPPSDQPGGKNVWYTKYLPGKGAGMLAQRRLERGDLILQSRPVLVVNPEKKMGRWEGEEVLGRAVDQLGGVTRGQYRGLARGNGDERWWVQDVLKSNDFEVQVGGKMHLAIFLEPARLNHDCSPNAQYYIDSETLTHYVHAVRPIAVDEEITISYTSPFQSAAARQEHLHKAFNFTCTCHLCTTHSESDKDLAEIKSIQALLGNWDSETPIHFAGAGGKALKLVELYQKLNLHAFLDMPFGFASLVFNSFGKEKKAVRYARMAAEAVEMRYGPGAADYAMWQSIIEDPKGHWSWNYRFNR